jgi:alpha-glucosidase
VKDPKLRSNPRLRIGGHRNPMNWDLEEVHAIHRRWRKVIDSYRDRVAVGEIFPDGLKRLVRYYGNDDELHMPFNFQFLERPWRAEAFRAVVEEWERLLPDHAWPDYTLSNHDRSRAATRYGLHRARTAAMMLLTLRGTPFIYYGEEIGMTDVPIPPERVVDVHDRDPERTPMQWDASRNAGFTAGRPWRPSGTIPVRSCPSTGACWRSERARSRCASERTVRCRVHAASSRSSGGPTTSMSPWR